MASIRKRGNKYQITVSNGRDTSGKQIIETTTFAPDPNKTDKQNGKALQRFVIDFEDRVKNGKFLDGEKMSFMDFSDKWLSEYVINRMEAKTYALYEDYLQRHINPVIGHLKLSKIQPTHLNSLYNKLLKERKDGRTGGYSAKTIKNIHDIISSLFKTAIQWNVMIDNPCTRIKPPKPDRQNADIKFFNLEQAQIFIELLDSGYQTPVKAHGRIDDTGKLYHVDAYTESRKISTQLKLFFLLALFCGMRRGELIALEWNDLNFENNTIDINKSTVSVNGKPVTKPPKTSSSIRTISVPDNIMILAKTYRKEQLQYRMTIGDQWIGGNHLFIQWSGKQMHPDTPYATFKKIIKRYNESIDDELKKLPNIPLHGLRHTSATLLISQNVDIRTVAGRMGHSRTSTTTDIYAHSLQKMDEQASSALENLFSQSQVK